MMDVVDADIRCEPGKDCRQLVMRAAVQCGGVDVPVLFILPCCAEPKLFLPF
jgi:hypothetical protein